MERLIETDLEKLTTETLTAMRLAQTAVIKAMSSIFDHAPAVAEAVIAADPEIDAIESAMDTEILRLLALHQPVAGDLRYILGCMRIVGDVERIGDQAVGIAKRGLLLAERQPMPPSPSLTELAAITGEFLSRIIVCFTQRDAEAAWAIRRDSLTIQDRSEAILKEMAAVMLEEAKPVEAAVQVSFIAHGLKRICDQCANVAESVIFIRQGACARHSRIAPPRDPAPRTA